MALIPCENVLHIPDEPLSHFDYFKELGEVLGQNSWDVSLKLWHKGDIPTLTLATPQFGMDADKLTKIILESAPLFDVGLSCLTRAGYVVDCLDAVMGSSSDYQARVTLVRRRDAEPLSRVSRILSQDGISFYAVTYESRARKDHLLEPIKRYFEINEPVPRLSKRK